VRLNSLKRNRRNMIPVALDPPPHLPAAEAKLWLAALAGSIQDLQLQSSVQDWDTPNLPSARMERRWFMSTLVRPGSFLWICELFDFDPDAIRTRVLAGLVPRQRRTDVGHIATADAVLRRRERRAKVVPLLADVEP
jgi:hypothetical protein